MKINWQATSLSASEGFDGQPPSNGVESGVFFRVGVRVGFLEGRRRVGRFVTAR